MDRLHPQKHNPFWRFSMRRFVAAGMDFRLGLSLTPRYQYSERVWGGSSHFRWRQNICYRSDHFLSFYAPFCINGRDTFVEEHPE